MSKSVNIPLKRCLIVALIVTGCILSQSNTSWSQAPATTDAPAQSAPDQTTAAAPADDTKAEARPATTSDAPATSPEEPATSPLQTPALTTPEGTPNTAADDTGKSETLTDEPGARIDGR